MFINNLRRGLPLLWKNYSLKSLTITNDLCTFSKNNDKLEKAQKLIQNRFKIFDDNDSEIIHDQTIDLDLILNQKQKRIDKKEQTREIAKRLSKDSTNLRGVEGVFDIEELLTFLKEERLYDVAVISVPKHLKYCQYFVICTGKSNNQIKKTIQALRRLYQVKKHPQDPSLNIPNDANDWQLIDLENIILHIFLPETRDFYDLETLWTVGEKYDDKTQRQSQNVVSNIIEQHFKFIDEYSHSSVNHS